MKKGFRGFARILGKGQLNRPRSLVWGVGTALAAHGIYKAQKELPEFIPKEDLINKTTDDPTDLKNKVVIFVWRHKLGEEGDVNSQTNIGHVSFMTSDPTRDAHTYISFWPKHGVNPLTAIFPDTPLVVSNIEDDIKAEGGKPDDIYIVKGVNSDKLDMLMKSIYYLSNSEDSKHCFYVLIPGFDIPVRLANIYAKNTYVRNIMHESPFSSIPIIDENFSFERSKKDIGYNDQILARLLDEDSEGQMYNCVTLTEHLIALSDGPKFNAATPSTLAEQSEKMGDYIQHVISKDTINTLEKFGRESNAHIEGNIKHFIKPSLRMY